ncbi:hypothetical protein BH24ACI3_BH24ACI3_12120 [soil metagenome]
MKIHCLFKTLAFAAFFAVFSAASISATTVAEYREDIDGARSIIWDMLSELAIVEPGQTPGAFNAEDVAEIREMLPVSATIKTNNGEQEVSHTWIHAKLDEFVTSNDMMKRAAILGGIDERLVSIETKIAQLERAAENGRRNKDEEKQRLAEILAREEFQKPAGKQESMFERWLASFLQWLDSLFRRPSGERSSIDGMPNLAFWLQIVLFTLVIGLIIFAAFRLLPAIFPSLRRRQKEAKDDRVILGDRIATDENASVLFDEAERLARSGDIRGAIRKGYIAILCELSDRKMIGLARNKTNRDYLRDVRARRELHEDMRTLTGSFESHWYGLQDSDAVAWENFRAKYKEAIARI